MKNILIAAISILLLGASCKKESFTIAEQVFVPTSFSPNGDAINDVFVVGISHQGNNIEVYKYHIEIFDKNDVKVFETNDLNHAWSGKGYPQGNYYYYLSIETSEGNAEEYGVVKLIR